MHLRRLALQGTLWPEWPPADEALVWILDITTSKPTPAASPGHRNYRPGKRRSTRAALSSAWTPRARQSQ